MRYIIIFNFLFSLISFDLIAQIESSGWCQDNMNVNSNITPPALDNFKRAVVKIRYPKTDGSWWKCTGTIVNQNVSQNNLKQVVLYAKHCLEDADFSKEWIFTFNYQSPDNNNESVPLDYQNGISIGNRNGERYIFFHKYSI